MQAWDTLRIPLMPYMTKGWMPQRKVATVVNTLALLGLSQVLLLHSDFVDPGGENGCTIVMPVCHRLRSLEPALLHYSRLPFPSQIIIVRQPCTNETFEIPSEINGVAILVKNMPTNDMNNRYIDFNETMFNCIINIDDDILHPTESIAFLHLLWQNGFQDSYVGWVDQARLHSEHANGYTYHLGNMTRRMGGMGSILLPSGSIYHREFSRRYNSHENAPARRVVSLLNNCDDLLMNFVIANMTDKGPVLVRDMKAVARSEALQKLSRDPSTAQWLSTGHVEKRGQCLSAFRDVYGKMPLKYATCILLRDKSSAEQSLSCEPLKRIHIREGNFPTAAQLTYETSFCELVESRCLAPDWDVKRCVG